MLFFLLSLYLLFFSESWYEVEREGISHVGSSEEVAEMLAEAVTEHQKKGLDQPLSL